ncbi:unnamed protein product [Boreogadus saida]
MRQKTRVGIEKKYASRGRRSSLNAPFQETVPLTCGEEPATPQATPQASPRAPPHGRPLDSVVRVSAL